MNKFIFILAILVTSVLFSCTRTIDADDKEVFTKKIIETQYNDGRLPLKNYIQLTAPKVYYSLTKLVAYDYDYNGTTTEKFKFFLEEYSKYINQNISLHEIREALNSSLSDSFNQYELKDLSELSQSEYLLLRNYSSKLYFQTKRLVDEPEIFFDNQEKEVYEKSSKYIHQALPKFKAYGELVNKRIFSKLGPVIKRFMNRYNKKSAVKKSAR